MENKDYYVYVQAMDGTPLMPTRRFGWVRRTLKKGMVRVVTVRPFTIRLNYEPKTRITQPITLGIDPEDQISCWRQSRMTVPACTPPNERQGIRRFPNS